MQYKSAIALAATLMTASATAAITLPSLAAAACPACYGLQKLAPNLYSDAPNPQLVAKMHAASAQVAAIWGPMQAHPIVLACQSEACDRRLGGHGSLGITYGAWVIRLAPAGASQTIATHELTHAELHARLGIWETWQNHVPAWLDEGIAVLVSNDPRYLNRPHDCTGLTRQSLPQTAQDWSQRARTEHDKLYTQAACAATDWLAPKGGLTALPQIFP